VQIVLVYAHIGGPAVSHDYRSVLGEEATLAGPSSATVRNRELGPEAIDWLKRNLFSHRTRTRSLSPRSQRRTFANAICS
jgi:hypothetical protein